MSATVIFVIVILVVIIIMMAFENKALQRRLIHQQCRQNSLVEKLRSQGATIVQLEGICEMHQRRIASLKNRLFPDAVITDPEVNIFEPNKAI